MRFETPEIYYERADYLDKFAERSKRLAMSHVDNIREIGRRLHSVLEKRAAKYRNLGGILEENPSYVNRRLDPQEFPEDTREKLIRILREEEYLEAYVESWITLHPDINEREKELLKRFPEDILCIDVCQVEEWEKIQLGVKNEA